MNKVDNLTNQLDGVADYLNDLYRKQGGNLNQIGDKTINQVSNKLTTLVNGIVFGLATRSHSAIVTFINDSNQEHDQDDMDVDRHSAEAHIESLELTMHHLGLNISNAAKAKRSVIGAIDVNHDQLIKILNKAQKLIDHIQKQYNPTK